MNKSKRIIKNKAYITDYDMLTPYGRGAETLWKGIVSGRDAISEVERFDTSNFRSSRAGIIKGLSYHNDESLVMQMLSLIITPSCVPSDSVLLLSSTKGEVDLMEKEAIAGGNDPDIGGLSGLLGKVRALCGTNGRGLLVSAACVSSSAALAHAASMIQSGEVDVATVVACDAVTEFVYSGFSSLMALDESHARPFDRDRAGLGIGEAAAYAVLMSGERLMQENRRACARIDGWGLAADANHMTGPSRTGESLYLAVCKALEKASIQPDDIGSVNAHGTGTLFNDSMEMKAYKRAFGSRARPVYSVKGAIGHSMGAAGIIEVLLCIASLREGRAPATVNLEHPDPEAEGWANTEAVDIAPDGYALSTNAGFGGVNSALVISLAEDRWSR